MKTRSQKVLDEEEPAAVVGDDVGVTCCVSQHKECVQKWWLEQRESDTPPSPLDFLVNMGFDDHDSREFISNYFVKASELGSSLSHTIKPGSFGFLVQQCTDVLLKENTELTLEEDQANKVGYQYSLLSNLLWYNSPFAEADVAALVQVIRDESIVDGLRSWLLEKCLDKGFSGRLIDSIYNKFQDRDTYSLYFDSDLCNDERGFDMSRLRNISAVLTSVKTITNKCECWTEEAYLEFVRLVMTSKNTKSFTTSIPRTFVHEQGFNFSASQGFFDSISRLAATAQCGIERLEINWLRPQDHDLIKCFLNPSVRELIIRGDNLVPIIPTICRLLENDQLHRLRLTDESDFSGISNCLSALEKNTSLCHFRCEAENLRCGLTTGPNEENGLETLEIRDVSNARRMPPSCVEFIRSLVRTQPNIKELWVSGNDGIKAEIIPFIASVLDTHELKKLEMEGFGADATLSPIFDALERHSSLVEFNFDGINMHDNDSNFANNILGVVEQTRVLANNLLRVLEQNRVLGSANIVSASVHRPRTVLLQAESFDKMNHYLMLNRCGRSLVGSEDYCLEQLVNSLVGVEEDSTECQERERVGALYFFLRASPATWSGDISQTVDRRVPEASTHAQTRKRKRDT